MNFSETAYSDSETAYSDSETAYSDSETAYILSKQHPKIDKLSIHSWAGLIILTEI